MSRYDDLLAVLKEDELKKLRAGVVDIILKQIKEDLDASSYYIISPDGVSNMVNETIAEQVESMISDILEENKKTITAIVLKNFNIMGDDKHGEEENLG